MNARSADPALAWRKLDPVERAGALRRWCERVTAQSDALSQRVGESLGIDAADALQYDLAALAAALDELASVAPAALQPERARRWLSGEPIARRAVAPERASVTVPPSALLAPSLAWTATLLCGGAAVTLRAPTALHPALRALLDAAPREDALPVMLEADDHEDPSEPPSQGPDAPAPPRCLQADAHRAPSLAWLEDAASASRALPSLVRAARYAGGGHRGALRWIAAKGPVIDALFAALGAERSAASHERDGVRWTRASYEPAAPDGDGMHVSLEAFDDEQSFVSRARAVAPLAAACAFGADRRRARSIALRTGADAVYVESTPADALGGSLRADFDARVWLAHATQIVAVVEGPSGALARIDGRSPLRLRWLRAWLRLQLGRYGLGGSVEDLW